jgi:hypothetical protein
MRDAVSRRSVVSVVAAAACVLAASCGASSSPAQTSADCRMSEVKGSTSTKDILSGVTLARGWVMAIGTRYLGSAGVPMFAEGATSAWGAREIPMAGPLPSEMGRIGGTAAYDEQWAVGAIGTFQASAPLILSWNGRAWAQAPAPDPGPFDDGLTGIAATSSSSAVAVGRHGMGTGAFRTLVERWDGTRWAIEPSPNRGSSAALNDVAVAGPNEAWAVGWAVDGSRYTTLAMHRTGSAWSVTPTPDLGPDDAVLYGVAIDGAAVWAVGWQANGDDVTPIVERWDGTAWSTVTVPLSVGSAAFSDVAARAGTVAIAGRTMVEGHSHPLVVIGRGGTWREVPVDHAMPQGSLTAVTVGPTGRVWAVGNQVEGNGVASSLVVAGC